MSGSGRAGCWLGCQMQGGICQNLPCSSNLVPFDKPVYCGASARSYHQLQSPGCPRIHQQDCQDVCQSLLQVHSSRPPPRRAGCWPAPTSTCNCRLKCSSWSTTCSNNSSSSEQHAAGATGWATRHVQRRAQPLPPRPCSGCICCGRSPCWCCSCIRSTVICLWQLLCDQCMRYMHGKVSILTTQMCFCWSRCVIGDPTAVSCEPMVSWAQLLSR